MSVHSVPLSARLVLVPGAKDLDQRFRQYSSWDGFPRSPYDIVRDLDQLRGGVPVTLDPPKPGNDNWSLLVHTRRYVVRLFLTQRGDAYSIASLSPLRLWDHQRLAEGHLLVRPRGWRAVNSTSDIPTGTSSGWRHVMSAWEALNADLAVSTPPTAAQEEFLRRLSGVIDQSERLDAENEGQRYPYRAASATGGKRTGAVQRYEFTLAGQDTPEKGTFVQLTGGSKARGQVTRVNGTAVTVRFDDLVDWNELVGQGELVATKGGVVYRTQREAVSQLRQGKARNPGVLAALVEGRVHPPRPGGPRPEFPLNPRQEEAFRKALTAPELLVVLGPPGTGKTTTITQIVQAAKQAGEKVIVCSHSNRAVDNVLTALPESLVAIRLGNPEKITPGAQAFFIDRHVAKLRSIVPGRAAHQLDAFRDLDDAQGWAAELARCNAEASDARATRIGAEQALHAARRAAGGPATEAVDQLTNLHAADVNAVERSARRARWLRAARDFAGARSEWALIGWLLAMLATLCGQKFAQELSRGEYLAGLARTRYAELMAAQRHLVEVTKDVPAVRAALIAMDDAAARATKIRAGALNAARACTGKLTLMATPPAVRENLAVREDLNGDTIDKQLHALSGWLADWLPRLAARRELLTDWLRDVSGDTGDLDVELIRYADVVATTCTGAGSQQKLTGMDFGLAIVDEAGQIGVADTLIPLVRARRAVLVGDHKQLPPYLASEVNKWGKGVDDPEVRALLSNSALELVVSKLAPDCANVVQLTEQRRMPEVIAKWVSAEFYGGELVTKVRREHRDALFSSPMTFVDTSGLPWEQRKERSGRERERWGQKGYDNPAEARLLADLAEHYHRLGADWAIIVPYRAQAELIVRQLAGRIGDAKSLEANIGSVDSFQGGERDVILYGFTRSNTERSVGFLRELRRVNVAVTRVKQQLVMVGDLDTLTQARGDDRAFGALARSLRAYVGEHGSIVGYEAIRARLDSRFEG